MLIHLLDERGLLHIDDRVVEYIPEFGKHGKDTITVRHVLTHRAGIPFASGGSDDDLNLIGDWDAVIRLLCEAEPESTHGRRVSYHAITGGFILGEIIQRVTGKSFTEVVETELRGPLGTSWFHFGIDRSSMPLVARSAMLGEAPTPPFSHLFKRAIGADFPRIPDIANDPRFLGAVVPSGNLVATAEEMTRFYQLLLDGGTFGGKRVFEPRTVRRARNESAYFEVDHTLVLPVRYGLGFMLGGRHVSLFGADTEFAFGHLGFTNTYTWADPARDISVALLTTGKTFVPYELWVQREILSAIAEHCPRVR
jgi:CubicO group peptidase (beta-lactamase class C family)